MTDAIRSPTGASIGSCRRSTWLLVIGLFILRMLLATWADAFAWQQMHWVLPLYYLGTYFLTALLIWYERDRLAAFHVDWLVLALFIVGKPLQALYYGYQAEAGPAFLYVLIGFGLGIMLLWARPRLPALRRSNFLWIIVGAGVGVLLAFYASAIFRVYRPHSG